MGDQFTPGQWVIYKDIDSYPRVVHRHATVVKVAEPWTTGCVPVQIRLRFNGTPLWVASQLLELDLIEADLAAAQPDPEGPDT